MALLDINLPEESGFEACRRLRQHSDVPVIFLTARESAELTKNETRILACLMGKELCTREEIIEDLWNNSLYIDENTLYVNINRLRDKLKKMDAKHYIRTVRGVGYRL